MDRRKLTTYALFGGAGALALVALASIPRHSAHAGPPDPPKPPPQPLVIVQPPPPPQPPQPPPPPPQPLQPVVQERPKIEVVFALDTTGSMSGLIEGAKRKIWSIADFIASGQPRPDVRIGLVAYRDVGDAYVTRFYDLSDDLDTVFARLSSFRADGGGDTPEHVARALHDAVERASWSEGQKVVKIVYLVGDAPPHTDYQDGYDYRAIARKAAKRGIHVNTIRCGSDGDTAQVWREIARLGSGDYASIHQNGGVAYTATPYDDKLADLNRRLAGTALGYGGASRRAEVRAKASAAMAAPASIAADRAAFAGKKGIAVSGDGDLVNDVATGRAKLDKIANEELPAEMQALPPAAQKAYVERKQIERQRILDEINRVSAERERFMKESAKKAKRPAGFDDEVRKSIATEAAGAVAY